MKPAARLHTTIELWNSLWQDEAAQHLPMDKFYGDFFRKNRFIGSKDRADLSGRLYGMMRCYARLRWWLEQLEGQNDNPRHMLFAYELLTQPDFDKDTLIELFSGEMYAPAKLNRNEHDLVDRIFALSKEDRQITHPDMPEDVKGECPDWAYADLKPLFGDAFEVEMKALQEAATVHLRVNTQKASVTDARASLKKEYVAHTRGLITPSGLRLKEATNVNLTTAYKSALIDVQDEGSQAIALACAAEPGMQVLDYCAGGGGKTLALGDVMQGKGRIVAMDNDEKRLRRGKKRYIRADIHNVEMRCLTEDRHRKWIKRQADKFDVVLVDAPCSGTGTWRRNPDMRWRDLTPTSSTDETGFEHIIRIQADILNRVATYVKKGGALVYATCSLLPQENERQIEAFLANHPEFKIADLGTILTHNETETPLTTEEGYMRLTPARHGTDGFFAARLIKAE